MHLVALCFPSTNAKYHTYSRRYEKTNILRGLGMNYRSQDIRGQCIIYRKRAELTLLIPLSPRSFMYRLRSFSAFLLCSSLDSACAPAPLILLLPRSRYWMSQSRACEHIPQHRTFKWNQHHGLRLVLTEKLSSTFKVMKRGDLHIPVNLFSRFCMQLFSMRSSPHHAPYHHHCIPYAIAHSCRLTSK